MGGLFFVLRQARRQSAKGHVLILSGLSVTFSGKHEVEMRCEVAVTARGPQLVDV